MYAVGGMKISVIAVGLCMLIMPRECTKSYSPVAVYDTDMLCICVVIVIEILAVWPAVRVTATVRLSGSAFVPQPAASTPTLTKTTTYRPRRIALPPFTPLRRPNSAVPGPGKQPISFFLALNRLDGWYRDPVYGTYQELSRLLCVNDGRHAGCLDQQIPRWARWPSAIGLAWGEHGLQ